MKKPYETPVLYELGTVVELTKDAADKCGGSGDQFRPNDPFPSGCPAP